MKRRWLWLIALFLAALSTIAIGLRFRNGSGEHQSREQEGLPFVPWTPDGVQPPRGNGSSGRAVAADTRDRRIAGVLRLKGVPDADVNGTIRIALGADADCSRPSEVVVRAGQWQLDDRIADYVLIYGIDVQAETWTPLCRIVAVPADGRVVIDATRMEDVGILVVDQEPGRHIGEVSLLWCTEKAMRAFQFRPHIAQSVVASKRIPVNVRPPIVRGNRPTGDYMVTAPGYTWGLLTMGHSRSYPSIVWLQRSGGLRLFVSGAKELKRSGYLELRLFERAFHNQDGDLTPAYRFPVADSNDLELEKLEPREYVLELVHAPPGGVSVKVFHDVVAVHAAQTTTLDVELPENDTPEELCKVAGIIYYPTAGPRFPLDHISIEPVSVRTIHAVDVMKLSVVSGRILREDGCYRWQDLNLNPGTYRICLGPTNTLVELVVPQKPDHLEVIALPGGIMNSVHVLNAHTKEPVSIRSVLLNQSIRESDLERRPFHGPSLAGSNPIEFVKWGEHVELQIGTIDHGDHRIRLGTGEQTLHVVELIPPLTGRVSVSALGQPFPMEPAWWQRIRVDCVEGKVGDYLGFSLSEESVPGRFSQAEFRFRRAGTYRVSFPALAGYERRSGSLEVLLEAGSFQNGFQDVDVTSCLLPSHSR